MSTPEQRRDERIARRKVRIKELIKRKAGCPKCLEELEKLKNGR